MQKKKKFVIDELNSIKCKTIIAKFFICKHIIMFELTEELFQRIKAPIVYQGPGPVKFGRGVHGNENTLVTIHSNRSVDVMDLEVKKEEDKVVEITDDMFKRAIVYKGPGPVKIRGGTGLHGSKNTRVTVYANGDVIVEGLARHVGKNENVVINGGVVGLRLTN